jgi:hypothetical protein
MVDWKIGWLDGWKIGRLVDWETGKPAVWTEMNAGNARGFAFPIFQPSSHPIFQSSILPMELRSETHLLAFT